MTNTISALVCDQFGVVLDDIQSVFPRSMFINDTGKTEFIMSLNDAKCTQQNLIEGNLLLIENDDGLPDWIGVIDDPQYWTEGQIKVTAYTPDFLFKYRRGSGIATQPSGHIGSYLNVIRHYFNSCGGTQIAAGIHHNGPKVASEKIDTAVLLDELKRLCTTYNFEYTFTPSRDANGRVIINMNWLEQQGHYKPDICIDDNNCQMVSDQVVYNGPIINDCLAFGTSGTWDSKGNQTYVNQSSKNTYGPRMITAQCSTPTNNSNEQAMLTETAKSAVKASAVPSATFRLSVTNNPPGTWQGIRLGDILPFHSVGYGWSSKGGTGLDCLIRVMGMACEEVSGVLGLNVIIWNGNL